MINEIDDKLELDDNKLGKVKLIHNKKFKKDLIIFCWFFAIHAIIFIHNNPNYKICSRKRISYK
jgi:hypothetical protein